MDHRPEDYAGVLQRARRGEQTALEELVRVYEREVRIVARVTLGKALRPYLDSLDLVQSVHRCILLGLRQDKFDISTPQQLVALAMTIVRRKVARHWRRLQRQERLSGGLVESDNLSELLTSLSDSRPDPGRAAEFQDEVERLCDQLNERERRLIELRLEGCSTAEAARVLHVDPDVLRVQLNRLRRRLKQRGVLTDWI